MIIILFALGFSTVFLFTKSYKYVSRYYPTIQFVCLVSTIYPLICRGYMVWRYPNWGLFTDKVNELFQFLVLFPPTTVLFLRYLPAKIPARIAYFLGFIGLFAGMEALMFCRKEIIYNYGWSYGWSVFIDVCLFSMLWLHAKNWKAALPISVCILIFLVIWFRVPIDG